MIATVDVMIFIVILTIVAVMIMPQAVVEEEPTDAYEIGIELSRTRVSVGDFVEGSGSDVIYSLPTVVTVAMNMNDTGAVTEYIESNIENHLDGKYGYKVVFVFNGRTLEIGNGTGEELSHYEESLGISISEKTIKMSVSLYMQNGKE